MDLIEIKTTGGGFEQLIARLQAFDKAALEEQIAQAIVADIKYNTGNSIDVHGQTFKPYTPGYAKKRLKMGLGTEVDLRVTGQMLEALTVEKQGLFTVISDADPNQGKVKGNQNLRQFIGISQQAKEKMLSLIRSFVGTIITTT